MGQDFTITKVGWETTRIPLGSLDTVEAIHNRHRILLQFLQRCGLTVRTVLADDEPITDESKLMRSDLTDDGFEVYRRSEQKWLKGIDRGKDPADMRVFENELIKVLTG